VHTPATADRLVVKNDPWPEGSGIEESTGMGAEKLDVAVYTIRALNDLEEMAARKGDLATRNFARHKARELSRRFDGDWWEPDQGLVADSLTLDYQVPDDPNQTLGPAPTTTWVSDRDLGCRRRQVIEAAGQIGGALDHRSVPGSPSLGA
jgi:hypothetical protein